MGRTALAASKGNGVVSLETSTKMSAFDPTEMRLLLGGKGAGLFEMRQLGLPVPPAFVLTTKVCNNYLVDGWDSNLDAEIEAAVDELERLTDRRFGGASNPLLVSVRSGAPVSMPGMMDTVLNVGMNDEVRLALAAESGSERFANQTWLRFTRMYSEIVLGVPSSAIEGVVGTDHRTADPGELAEVADRVSGLAAERGGIPQNPLSQLRRAIIAVFDSWRSSRADVFRATEGIDEALGTAAIVQVMVFGNRDDRSGTGVFFTRDPATGLPGPYGDFLVDAQGEDVVAGTHEVEPLAVLNQHQPELFGELVSIGDRLEKHYQDMCDIEFTISSGRLYILQTRVGRRSPLAAVRMATAMANDPDFPLSRREAVARIRPDTLIQLSAQGVVADGATPLAVGIAASPGVGVGVLCCDPDQAADLAQQGAAVVLARRETSPSDVHGMVGAAAVVTSLGGSSSHAAVVARGWGIPAVTGAGTLRIADGGCYVGEHYVAEGALITVCGTTGSVYVGDQRDDTSPPVAEVEELRRWAAETGQEFGASSVDEVRPEQDATTSGSSAESSISHELSELALARIVQLKGMCTSEAAAEALSVPVGDVDRLAKAMAGRLTESPRGWALDPSGRAWVQSALSQERETVDQSQVDEIYREFIPLNDAFKILVFEWQNTDRGEAAVAETASRLQDLHDRFAPIVDRTCAHASRLQPFVSRFERALEAVAGGDGSMVASPLKDSYHTAWFEFHEELICLSGRNRADEERAEAERHGG